MTEFAVIEITSTAESALKKLKKAEIPVYNCKKQGANFIFSVKDKHIKKVFAIFAKPCYNITVKQNSAKNRLLSSVLLRIGLVVGAAIFAFAAFLSDLFILKIEVQGSGSYLESDVRRILADGGGEEWKLFSAMDKTLITGRILALPQVVFCNLEKCGSVLKVDVRVDGVSSSSASRSSLISDVNGTVKKIAVMCGTAAVEAGQEVKRGDVLIYAHNVTAEGKTRDCIAVGYAEIECKKQVEYFAVDDSEESRRLAYASANIEGDEILSRSHVVKPADGGFVFVIDLTYLHKLSINLT